MVNSLQCPSIPVAQAWSSLSERVFRVMNVRMGSTRHDQRHRLMKLFGNKKARIRNAASLATAAAVLEGVSKLIPDMPDNRLGQ
jgi:hypothetical protein